MNSEWTIKKEAINLLVDGLKARCGILDRPSLTSLHKRDHVHKQAQGDGLGQAISKLTGRVAGDERALA